MQSSTLHPAPTFGNANTTHPLFAARFYANWPDSRHDSPSGTPYCSGHALRRCPHRSPVMSGIWHSGDVEGQGEDEAVRADLRREGAGMKWGMRDTVGRLRKFCGSVKKVVRKLVVRTSEEGSRAVPEARHVPTVEVHVVGNNAGVQKVASREETARLVEGVARRRDSSRRRSELVQTLGEQEAYVLEGMITPDQVEDGERASYFGEVMGSR